MAVRPAAWPRRSRAVCGGGARRCAPGVAPQPHAAHRVGSALSELRSLFVRTDALALLTYSYEAGDVEC